MFTIRAHAADTPTTGTVPLPRACTLGDRRLDVIDFVAVAAPTCLDHPGAGFGDAGQAGDASTPFPLRPWRD